MSCVLICVLGHPLSRHGKAVVLQTQVLRLIHENWVDFGDGICIKLFCEVSSLVFDKFSINSSKEHSSTLMEICCWDVMSFWKLSSSFCISPSNFLTCSSSVAMHVGESGLLGVDGGANNGIFQWWWFQWL